LPDLLENFKRIEGDSGTLVMIYNLKLQSDGLTELDFDTDPHDIQMRDFKVEYYRK
jgi:hypothetical protein